MKSIYRLLPVLVLFFLPDTFAPKDATVPIVFEANTGPVIKGPQVAGSTPVFGPRNNHHMYFNTYIVVHLSAPVSGAPYPTSFSRNYTAWGVGTVDVWVQPQHLCQGFKMNLDIQVGNNSYFVPGIAPGSSFTLRYPHYNDQVSIGGWTYAAQWPAPTTCSNGLNRVTVTIF